MSKTRTGGFPIGFRRGWSDWQKDLPSLIAFAKANGLECIDLARTGDVDAPVVAESGLRFGSVDLPEWRDLSSPDKAKRDEAVARNAEYIGKCAEFGVKNFFVVVQLANSELKLSERFDLAVQGYGALADVLAKHEAWVVIEGYPGADVPVCTPESYRIFLNECPARMAINYDPSHLIRQGIDPIRFLHEFAPRVQHIHAKDTEIFHEALYEHGHEKPPVRAKTHGFGSAFWRYTIPGHGEMRWREAFAILEQAGYQGCVSIELEDENFNGSEEGEKQGLIRSAHFLAGC